MGEQVSWSSPKNKIIKAAWSVLPKVICWQIWLERNRRIFRNIEQNYKALEIKIKCHLKDCLIDLKDDSNLIQQDIAWGSFLDLNFQKDVRKFHPPKAWKIRESETDFQDWLTTQPRHSLFFDGVANSGKAGAGGIILNPDGKKNHSFAWGLGHSTSTKAEALALFQGLKMLKDLNISEANVFGDSQIIIKAIVSNSLALDLKLARLIVRIKGLENTFQKLNFYHVLRTNNKEADIEANKVSLLSAGITMKDEEESWEPIP